MPYIVLLSYRLVIYISSRTCFTSWIRLIQHDMSGSHRREAEKMGCVDWPGSMLSDIMMLVCHPTKRHVSSGLLSFLTKMIFIVCLQIVTFPYKYSRHELTLLPWWGMKWRFLTTTVGPLYILFIGLALLVDKTEGWLSKSRLNWCDWIDSNQRRPQKHILCPGIFTVFLL